MIGACVKTTVGFPRFSASVRSNHASCSSSMNTSWLLYSASRKRTVERPTRRWEPHSRAQKWCCPNCSRHPWRLAASEEKSSKPSRSWLPGARGGGGCREKVGCYWGEKDEARSRG